MRQLQVLALAAVSLLLLSGQALAQQNGAEKAPAKKMDRAGHMQLGVSVGFGISPADFAFALEPEFFVTNEVSIVPRFSVIHGGQGRWPIDTVSEDIYTLSMDLRYSLPINQGNDAGIGIRPFLNGGFSFTIVNWGPEDFLDPLDADIFDDTDYALSLDFGGGLDLYVVDQLAIGTAASFYVPMGSSPEYLKGPANFFPAIWPTPDEDFYFQWQFVTLRVLL